MSTPVAAPPQAGAEAAGPGEAREPAAAEPVWTVETHRDGAALYAIGAEWDDLARRCATATPFQSHAWLASWWRRYGRPGRLRLVLVRRNSRLVAAAALRHDRHWYGGVLTPLGGALADFGDVLADDAVRDDAVPALARALARWRGWQVLDVPEARPGSLAGGLLREHWAGRHWAVPASLCLELAACEPERLVRELPAHARKTVRRRINQLEKLGIATRPVPEAECDRAVAGLLALHRRQWQGRGVNPAHLRPAFAAHLTEAVPAMVHSGQAVLLEYRLGDRVVAANLIVASRSLAGGYLYGAEPELRDQIDVSTLLVTSTLAEANRRGCAVMSMLRGAEPYKARWRPTEVTNERILLARPGRPLGTGYAGAVRGRAAAVRWAKRRAPWLRTVRDTVLAKLRWRPGT